MFAGTLRPRNGITDEDRVKFEKWVRKACTHYFFTLEKQETEGQHMHWGIVLPKEWRISNVRLTVRRMYPHWEAIELEKGIKIKPWYSDAWYAEYCEKEGPDAIYEQNMPENLADLPWPAEDDTQLKRPLSVWYDNLEKKYFQEHEHPPPTLREVQEFVMGRMVINRDVEAIADKRVFNQRCEFLLRYMWKDNSFAPVPEIGVCERCKQKRDYSEFVS